jgi:hypothetical protein
MGTFSKQTIGTFWLCVVAALLGGKTMWREGSRTLDPLPSWEMAIPQTPEVGGKEREDGSHANRDAPKAQRGTLWEGVEKPEVAEVVRRLAPEVRSPFDFERCFGEAILRMSPSQLNALRTSLLARSSGPSSSDARLNSLLEMRTAEFSPKQAYNFYVAASLETGDEGAAGGMALFRWVAQDPAGFSAAMLETSPEGQRCVASFAAAMAPADPVRFARLLAEIGEEAALAAASSAAGPLVSALGAEHAVAQMEQWPEGRVRESGLHSPALLAKIGESLEKYPQVQDALRKLDRGDLQNIAHVLPKVRKDILSGTLREAVVEAGVQETAMADLEKAAEQVRGMMGTGDHGAAARGLVQAIAPQDPVAALEWALTVDARDSKNRQAALLVAAEAFYARDPEGARRWAEAAPLSAEEYFVLTGRKRAPR